MPSTLSAVRISWCSSPPLPIPSQSPLPIPISPSRPWPFFRSPSLHPSFIEILAFIVVLPMGVPTMAAPSSICDFISYACNASPSFVARIDFGFHPTLFILFIAAFSASFNHIFMRFPLPLIIFSCVFRFLRAFIRLQRFELNWKNFQANIYFVIWLWPTFVHNSIFFCSLDLSWRWEAQKYESEKRDLVMRALLVCLSSF